MVETNHSGGGVEALRRARRDGFTTHFVCKDPAEYSALLTSPVDECDRLHVVDTVDPEALTALASELSTQSCCAVVAYDDVAIIPAAHLAEMLGISNAPTVRSTRTMRFKDELRAALVDTPWETRHAVVDTDGATSPLGYPCVVKPTDGAGNYAVAVCFDDADYVGALESIGDFASREYNRGYFPRDRALVEEFMRGEEYSAELVWSADSGGWELIGYTTKRHLSSAVPLEVEHIFPFVFDDDRGVRILEELRAILGIIGVTHTVVHVEFMVDLDAADAPVSIVEVNGRPAGGHINDLVELVTGASLIDHHIAAATGTGVRPGIDAAVGAGTACAGIRFLVPEPGQTLREIATPSDLDGLFSVSCVDTPFHVPVILNSDSRVGYAIASGPSPQSVRARLDRFVDSSRLTYA
ncbi:ATP-grasp domain-containing protein [Williamsia sp.]|uniref:ATP-grasp domain-containing protein n=1 Tax=Williamsia sp. TaxID=1872085 RepID=UPI001A240F39|nr:ATP-grasp domain-containing protein [Williamsia sp.]MBJ7291444.1 ATP-grasp domain-containing protein [Williamsia sp.]